MILLGLSQLWQLGPGSTCCLSFEDNGSVLPTYLQSLYRHNQCQLYQTQSSIVDTEQFSNETYSKIPEEICKPSLNTSHTSPGNNYILTRNKWKNIWKVCKTNILWPSSVILAKEKLWIFANLINQKFSCVMFRLNESFVSMSAASWRVHSLIQSNRL